MGPPLHWARFRREGKVPGRVRRVRRPVDEGRVDAEAWRRAEEQIWEQVEDRRWLGFWRLESRARTEWAELHKRQEDTQQRLDRESRTVRGRFRIWRTERASRELVGAVRGREDLVEGWRADLDRYHKGERAALGKARADSARQIEQKVRDAYPKGLRDAERREPPTDVERAARQMKERNLNITRVAPRPPGPEAPSVVGKGSSDDAISPVNRANRFPSGSYLVGRCCVSEAISRAAVPERPVRAPVYLHSQPTYGDSPWRPLAQRFAKWRVRWVLPWKD